jgi:hypothetical protein
VLAIAYSTFLFVTKSRQALAAASGGGVGSTQSVLPGMIPLDTFTPDSLKRLNDAYEGEDDDSVLLSQGKD